MRRICIFDWAGTIVDKGSIAPLVAFRQTFKQFGISNISDSQINQYMGMDKYTHLFNLTKNDELTQKMYPHLIMNMKDAVKQYSIPVPGVNEIFRYLLSKKYIIGTTSGYNRELLNIAINTAFLNGMMLPISIASDEVKNPRPKPDMILQNIRLLSLLHGQNFDNAPIVKVGDTVIDIQEGCSVNAICNIGISNDPKLTGQMYENGATHVIKNLQEIFTIL